MPAQHGDRVVAGDADDQVGRPVLVHVRQRERPCAGADRDLAADFKLAAVDAVQQRETAGVAVRDRRVGFAVAVELPDHDFLTALRKLKRLDELEGAFAASHHHRQTPTRLVFERDGQIDRVVAVEVAHHDTGRVVSGHDHRRLAHRAVAEPAQQPEVVRLLLADQHVGNRVTVGVGDGDAVPGAAGREIAGRCEQRRAAGEKDGDGEGEEVGQHDIGALIVVQIAERHLGWHCEERFDFRLREGDVLRGGEVRRDEQQDEQRMPARRSADYPVPSPGWDCR